MFSKKSFRNTIRESNSLDPDHDRHFFFVGPDLGPNLLQRLSADESLLADRVNLLLYRLFLDCDIIFFF